VLRCCPRPRTALRLQACGVSQLQPATLAKLFRPIFNSSTRNGAGRKHTRLRAWSALSYNNNTTLSEHNQSERTGRSTTGSESCRAHFLVTSPQHGTSIIVQKHTSRSTSDSRELLSTYVPCVASKKKHAQFPRSIAGTHMQQTPFTLPQASLTSLHTYHWNAVK